MRVSSGSGPGSAFTVKLKVGPSHKRPGLASGPQPANGAPSSPKTNNQLSRVKARRAYTTAPPCGIGRAELAKTRATRRKSSSDLAAKSRSAPRCERSERSRAASGRDPKAMVVTTRVVMPTVLATGPRRITPKSYCLAPVVDRALTCVAHSDVCFATGRETRARRSRRSTIWRATCVFAAPLGNTSEGGRLREVSQSLRALSVPRRIALITFRSLTRSGRGGEVVARARTHPESEPT
jgi:hypothetical protein